MLLLYSAEQHEIIYSKVYGNDGKRKRKSNENAERPKSLRLKNLTKRKNGRPMRPTSVKKPKSAKRRRPNESSKKPIWPVSVKKPKFARR